MSENRGGEPKKINENRLIYTIMCGLIAVHVLPLIAIHEHCCFCFLENWNPVRGRKIWERQT